MKHELIKKHEQALLAKENYLSELKIQKEKLQKEASKKTDDVNAFMKKQEAEFKLKSINLEIEKIENKISEMKTSEQLYLDMQKEITDFREKHYQDSKKYNDEIVAKIEEINEIQSKIKADENRLIEEMTRYIADAKEYLPDSYESGLGLVDPERELTNIANGRGLGAMSKPVLERLNIANML